MSYILEALRKSERERQRKHAPSLTAAVAAEQPAPRRSWLPWLMVALLVAGNTAALIYFLQNHRSEAPATAAAPPSAVAGKTEPDPPRAEPATVAATPAPRPAAPTPALPPAAAVAAPPATAPPAAPEQHPPRQDAEPVMATSRPLPPRAAEKPARRRPAPVTPADDDAAGDTADDKPAYRINVLAYSSDPQERFAIINMTRYTKGEQMPDGTVVEDIEPGGVILLRNGKRIRISR